ncbi:MAG: serine hydrolase domain-containing protein [Actinomycetota bacterium]
MTIVDDLEALVDTELFSGVVWLGGPTRFGVAGGFADRANQRPNSRSTRFATASGTKGFTALATMSLIEDGALTPDTTVRSIVGDDLPNVDETVTIEHLLSHRSGIGDYLDEDELDHIDAHILDRSAHEFTTPCDFVPLLAVPAQKQPPDETFTYNNSGFMILSVIIERLTGSFVDTISARVFEPAGMINSGFFRSDDLPPDTALGYLENGRTNVFHLPVVGGGDGGAYVNVEDLDRFWTAVLDGRVVSADAITMMTNPRSADNETTSYGLGFWLSATGDHVWLEGMDAGVSMQTGVRRSTGERYSVLANTSAGAWPLVKRITDGW